MKTQAALIILIFTTLCASGQSTITGNFSTTATDYVGWDNSTSFDLIIEHQNTGQNIDFHTGGSQTMTLTSGGNLGIGLAALARASLP